MTILPLDTIQQADALEWLKALPGDSVDCIITDPPYGTIACEWDNRADMEALWIEFKRIIKPGGAVCIFGSQPFTSYVVMSNPQWFRYEWIWEKSKGVGYLNANRHPMKSHENILVFYEAPGVYNPQMEDGEPWTRNNGGLETGGYIRDKNLVRTKTVSNGQRYPKTILRFSSDTGLHPTQKPVALIEYLILTYTNPGAIVCDPFMGSGTTAIAARRNHRHFIGCDLSAEYVELANNRLAKPYTPTMLELTGEM